MQIIKPIVMIPSEELAKFVEANILPQTIKNETWCETNHTLDWLMQKEWTNILQYQSWPDGIKHTVYEGLKKVFDFIQDVDESYRNIEKTYREKVYDLYCEMRKMIPADDAPKQFVAVIYKHSDDPYVVKSSLSDKETLPVFKKRVMDCFPQEYGYSWEFSQFKAI